MKRVRGARGQRQQKFGKQYFSTLPRKSPLRSEMQFNLKIRWRQIAGVDISNIDVGWLCWGAKAWGTLGLKLKSFKY